VTSQLMLVISLLVALVEDSHQMVCQMKYSFRRFDQIEN